MGDSSSDDSDGEKIERLDKYEWHEEPSPDGKSTVTETYEVHWANTKMVTRENIRSGAIDSGTICRYWNDILNAVIEHEEMIKRGEKFAETKQMHNHRTSHKTAQALLQSKLRNLLPPNLKAFEGTSYRAQCETAQRSGEKNLTVQKPPIKNEVSTPKQREANPPAKKRVAFALPLPVHDEDEDEESEEEPEMEEQTTLWEVKKVDNYRWTEKKVDGKREIEQTYEVFWVGYKKTTREKASDITPDNMASYWRLVKDSLDEYDKMKERGEKFAETKQAYKYRMAFNAAERLRKKNLPGVVVPNTDGIIGDCMEVEILSSSDSEEEPPQPEQVRVRKYEWKEVPGMHGTTSILQTYEVHWTCGKQPTRELCMNIHAEHITKYWESVKNTLKKYEDMEKRGEKFAETKQAYNARKAHEAAEDLRRRNIPHVYPIEMHGYSGNYLQAMIDRLDANIDKKLTEKKFKKSKRRR